MQPLAAYYVFLANEEARQADARPHYRTQTPRRSTRSRFSAAVATLARPVRRSAGSPA